MSKKPNHQKINTWFNLSAMGGKNFKAMTGRNFKTLTVRPYNAEDTDKHVRGPGWSHGLTNFEIKETGSTGFCGTTFFDRYSKPVQKRKRDK